MIDVRNFFEEGARDTTLIIDIDAHIRNKKEGYRNIWSQKEDLLVSDSLSELTNILEAKPSATIVSGDKIMFSSGCNYPALLISQLKPNYPNIDISRTITESKATKFIFNKNPIEYPTGWSYYRTNEIHLAGVVGTTRYICTLPNLTDKQRIAYIKQGLESVHNTKFYFSRRIHNPESTKLFVKHINEAVSTQELTKYVNKFIPSVTDDELKIAFNYLKSSDDSIRKTGIKLFDSWNIGGKIYEVIKNLNSLYYYRTYLIPSSKSDMSSSWRYLLQAIDCDIDDIKRDFNSNQPYFLRKIMANPVYDGDMKSIKEEIKTQLIKRLQESPEFKTLREDLKLINCELILHDKDGETDPGN